MQRMRLVDTSIPAQVEPEGILLQAAVASESLTPAASPEEGLEHELARLWRSRALALVMAAHWVDSLPVRFDVQDGGVKLTLRWRGP
jgi:hypothetical protein